MQYIETEFAVKVNSKTRQVEIVELPKSSNPRASDVRVGLANLCLDERVAAQKAITAGIGVDVFIYALKPYLKFIFNSCVDAEALQKYMLELGDKEFNALIEFGDYYGNINSFIYFVKYTKTPRESIIEKARERLKWIREDWGHYRYYDAAEAEAKAETLTA
jgi:hypothetical protein